MPEMINNEIQGQSSLVRTQAGIVAGELTRRLRQPWFAQPGEDLDMVVRGVRQFLANLEDLREMHNEADQT